MDFDVFVPGRTALAAGSVAPTTDQLPVVPNAGATKKITPSALLTGNITQATTLAAGSVAPTTDNLVIVPSGGVAQKITPSALATGNIVNATTLTAANSVPRTDEIGVVPSGGALKNMTLEAAIQAMLSDAAVVGVLNAAVTNYIMGGFGLQGGDAFNPGSPLNLLAADPEPILTGDLIATATNDSGGTGRLGEYTSQLKAIGSPVSLTTATAANIVSVSLTAGDWDVEGQASFTEGTSTVTARSAGISTTSATLPTDGSEGYCGVQSTLTSETNTITLARKRISLASTTTVYLVASATFSAGTCGGFGVITARRVR